MLKNLKPKNANLMVIDIQSKMMPVIENEEQVVRNTLLLLKGAKILGVDTYFTEQYPKGLGNTIEELQEYIDREKFLEKASFSVYPEMAETLDSLIALGKNQFIIAGVEAHVCVYQTAKDLLRAGAEVYIAYDAVGSRDRGNYKQIIDSLTQMGVCFLPVEAILFELVEVSGTPQFKEISKLVK